MKKSFLIKILIYFIVFVIVVIFLNWLIKSSQSDRNKNEAENFTKYYKDLLAQCGSKEDKTYSCCFNSVEYMSANNYTLAPGLGCNPRLRLNTFNCQGAYKWCEMIR